MTILRAISAHNHRPLMRTIVQLIEPKNKQYLTAVGISEHNIVCINQLRMRIAAQARTVLATESFASTDYSPCITQHTPLRTIASSRSAVRNSPLPTRPP